jgi:hypothetical protein
MPKGKNNHASEKYSKKGTVTRDVRNVPLTPRGYGHRRAGEVYKGGK